VYRAIAIVAQSPTIHLVWLCLLKCSTTAAEHRKSG